MKMSKLLKLALLTSAFIGSDAVATENMLMPSAGIQYCALSGTCYTSNSNSIITTVATGDVVDMLRAGGYTLGQSQGISNLSASTSPGVTSDNTLGYAIGSRWLNTSTGIEYICTSATTGAAVWTQVGATTPALAYSTAPVGNPLVLHANGTVTVASANAASTLVLASLASNFIHPAGPITLMASGTAAGATSTEVYCSGGGTGQMLTSTPISGLLNNVPNFSSAVELYSAMNVGCPVNQAMYISNNGTMTTTSLLYYSFPYTLQHQ